MPTWIEALKKWNDSRSGTWCIPKKGTKDYDAVKRLMKVKGEGKMKGKGFLGDASKAFLGFNTEDIEKMDTKAVANLATAAIKTLKSKPKMKGGVKSLKELSADALQKRLQQLVEINPTTAPRLYGITPGALRKQIADIRNSLRLLGITPRA